MIRSFRHKGLQRFHETGNKAGIQAAHEKRLRTLLGSLETAKTPSDIGPPGLRLHILSGDMKDRWSVRVSGAWRVTFIFEDGDAWEVDYVQYH